MRAHTGSDVRRYALRAFAKELLPSTRRRGDCAGGGALRLERSLVEDFVQSPGHSADSPPGLILHRQLPFLRAMPEEYSPAVRGVDEVHAALEIRVATREGGLHRVYALEVPLGTEDHYAS